MVLVGVVLLLVMAVEREGDNVRHWEGVERGNRPSRNINSGYHRRGSRTSIVRHQRFREKSSPVKPDGEHTQHMAPLPNAPTAKHISRVFWSPFLVKGDFVASQADAFSRAYSGQSDKRRLIEATTRTSIYDTYFPSAQPTPPAAVTLDTRNRTHLAQEGPFSRPCLVPFVRRQIAAAPRCRGPRGAPGHCHAALAAMSGLSEALRLALALPSS